MEEPETKNAPKNSTLVRSTSRRSTPGRSTPGRSTPGRSVSSISTPGRSTSGRSPSGRSMSGKSISGMSTPGRSTPDRSVTPEPPPVPPATYHWEEVRRKRTVGGYPWTHLDKPPFDENTWVKYERDHVYEPVTPAASTDRISSLAAKHAGPPKDEGRHFLRIPLTEELVMADDTESEPESGTARRRSDGEKVGAEHDDRDDDDDEDDDEEGDCEDEDDEDDGRAEKKSDGSIYEGENENSSAGAGDASNTRIKAFQQKVKVKADILRAKLQGVTKRKPKQKIVVDAASNGEKSRRKLGQFATLPKKFTFNAAKVNFSTAFSGFSKSTTSAEGAAAAADDESAGARGDDGKGGRFSLPRFGFTRTSSESPRPSKSTRMMGASRMSIPGFRTRAGSDASKASKPGSPKSRIMDFGTYPRIFSKRRKTNAENGDKAKTPPPPQSSGGAAGSPGTGNKRKDSFRRRFFRSHKESTPGPTGERTTTAALAVEEELDEAHATSKESLAEFGDSDLQEVISLADDCSRRSNKDTKSLCSEHRPGVIEEIDSDEFFLREKGLSRGDVHISNYLSSEIRDVFRRSNRTRSVEGVNSPGGGGNRTGNGGLRELLNNDDGVATPVRPSRTNSLRRPTARAHTFDAAAADRFSTMPKSFGGSSRPLFGKSRPDDEVATPENIITSQTFEPSSAHNVVPSTFRVPWRTARKEEDTVAAAVVTHMPPKPPTRHQRMTKFSTFDTRSMIDLSRKRSQSQIGFLPSMNFSETVPKAPLRRSRTSLAGSDRDVSATSDGRPSWAPTPPLRRSRASLAAADLDAEDRSAAATPAVPAKARTTPPRPPPPQHQQQQQQPPAGYATVDKSLLAPPQSPARHRRKKSYDVIKSQEFGAFFTIPRSYSYGVKTAAATDPRPGSPPSGADRPPPPSRPARAYNTLGPSRPHRRRVPAREHEYGDVSDTDDANVVRPPSAPSSVAQTRSASLDDPDGPAKELCSGDVIEKMKLRPLPSPPPPPRKSRGAAVNGDADASPSAGQAPFLDRRDTSATSSDHAFFADVSRALAASSAKTAAAAADDDDDDVSVAVQTDPLPDGYELDDDLGSCCSAESDRPASSASSTARAADAPLDRPVSRTAAALTVDRPTSRTSTTTEYVDRPTSRMSTNAVENGYVMMPAADKSPAAAGGVICAQRISVNELQVGKMIVADIRGQRMGVEDVSGSSLKIAHLAAGVMAPSLEAAVATATAAVLPSSSRGGGDDDHDDHVRQHHHLHHRQDDDVSVQSSRVSSMYPEVDSDEDRASVLAAPTPPRRRSRPTTSTTIASAAGRLQSSDGGRTCSAVGTAVDLSSPGSTAVDPSITELSCQLFRLCHSNVCSLFNKVVQQVVPEDTEKRRDLQAALCFLSIILAGLLILGFGNEKTIHHHHWDFQFPPPNQ